MVTLGEVLNLAILRDATMDIPKWENLDIYGSLDGFKINLLQLTTLSG